MKVKLTKRTADSAKFGERDLFLWDSVLPGFGLKVTPKGRRVFVLQYWVNGRARRVTLGLYGAELTVDQARAKARNLRGQVAAGGDPAAERARVRAIPTLAEFAERYMAEHAAVKKKPRSYEGDALNLRLHVLPTLGRLRLDQVTRADVARFHAGMRDRPFQANRCLALLSMMFTLAEAWGVQPDGSNPTRHVQKYPERKVERYLSDAELARLGGALEDAANTGEHPSVIAAIRLLIFTGCRRDEILKLRWEYVDFERGCLNLPESKTGAKVVPLGAPALELLAKLPRNEGNPFVLPGKVPGKHFVGIQKAWERLRAQAGLSDVRLNDLRHTHASVGAAAGESLLVIGALLGHQQQATTQRYAHLSDDPVRAAAERIDEHLEAALKGRLGEVVPLKSER